VIAVLLEEGEAPPTSPRRRKPPLPCTGSTRQAEASAEPDCPLPPCPLRRSPTSPPIRTFPKAPKWCRRPCAKRCATPWPRKCAASEDVFLMGEEVAEYQGAYKITQGLLEEFGAKRVIDTPITEHGFAGIGVGAAMAGLRPIVEFMTFNFAMQAIDQIINSAAKTLYMSGGQMGAPIVFRGPNGAAARVGAQHSQCYAAWYSHIPGLKVVACPIRRRTPRGCSRPRSAIPTRSSSSKTRSSTARPSMCRSSMISCCRSARRGSAREGKDVTIVSFGIGMSYAIKAADECCRAMGIDAEVIDLRTILRPMDLRHGDRLGEKDRASGHRRGRLPAMLGREPKSPRRFMEKAFDYLDAPIITIAGKDVPMPYAANLEKLRCPMSPK
jgi:pyruvate dehydrogenase E1 component beta subunit